MNTTVRHATRPWGNPLGLLTVLGCASCLVYAAVAWSSRQFAHGQAHAERPILQVLGLFGLAFVCYAGALIVAVRARESRSLLWAIVLFGVGFRAIVLFSWPILEIDIYRYLWDGEVTACGISPFRYSPQQVLSAPADAELPADLRRLVELRDSSPSTATILSRIHYEELPTIYPPLSQAVFALCAMITPEGSSVFARLVMMKTFFVTFDLATLAVVIGLLRITGRHLGWSVAYGWCPLVIKEFANSGHLDAVAVFLATLALYFSVKPLANRIRGPAGRAQTMIASVLLALAVGAKLYPLVLVPLSVLVWSRAQGWRWAAMATATFLVATTVLLRPMVPAADDGIPSDADRAVADEAAPPLPVDTATFEPQDPSGGLKAFLRRWEMNDFLFLLVVENLKPTADSKPGRRAWFSIVPETWKAALLSISSRWLPAGQGNTAFVLARLATGLVFVLIGASLLWRARSSSDPAVWLRAAFLTLAWFWLLSPTQNPWYWTWALPLVAFARSRVWLAVSGLTMIYYFRFWLLYHRPDGSVLGTGYDGRQFFDFVVAWIEYGPWFAWLGLEWWSNRRAVTSITS